MSEHDDAETAASSDREDAADGGGPSRLRQMLGAVDRGTQAVVGITLLALAVRLYELGWRVMHFDEGRVAYWTLYWTRTGDWHYRYIIHGPFVQHVNHWLFAILGPSDFVARLPVAVVGGLLPLSVVLYREHFADAELAGIATVLALNPVLVYYSRFLRSDVLVAGLMFAALGFFVRLYDERTPRYLYLAVFFVALAFSAKENAVVYLVSWVGMLASVAGMELIYPRRFESREAFLRWLLGRVEHVPPWLKRFLWASNQVARAGVDLVAEFIDPREFEDRDAVVERFRWRVDDWTDWSVTASWAGNLVGALLLAGAVVVYFYAPRSAQPGAGFWQTSIVASVNNAQAAIERGLDHWGGTGVPGCFTTKSDTVLHEYFGTKSFWFNYFCNLGREALVLKKAALATSILAIIGFVTEWPRDGARWLVTGSFAWGIASVVGYPYGSDIMFPAWLVVHVAVPLAIPAGVGLGTFVNWSREAYADDDLVDAAVAALVAVLLVTSMAGTAAHYSYAVPQGGDSFETNLAQYAQPEGEMQPAIRTLDAVAGRNDGVDVVVYGDEFVDMGSINRRKPACVKWLLPMVPVSYYLYRSKAKVRCADKPRQFRKLVERTDPPIVIVSQAEAHVPADALGDEYVRAAYGLRLGASEDKTVVFFFDTEQVDWNETA